MFNKLRRPSMPPEKPDDEKRIENEAHVAIGKSREQISRATDILKAEIKRLDSIIQKGH